MRLLTWQWGRRGAGPRIALDLTDAFATVPGVEPLLSLSRGAEIMQGQYAPFCDLPVDTYSGGLGFLGRAASAPRLVPRLARHLVSLAPDMVLCAMPGPLDLAMHAALHRCGIPYAVIVHDADPHPGDGYPMQMRLQAALVRRAGALVVLSRHVADRLMAQNMVGKRPLIMSQLPPMRIKTAMPPPYAHGGKRRLLSFGRLLPYKGLDLLAGAMAVLLPRDDIELRVVGSGPESAELDALRALPGVTVENRWVAETEIPKLLAWADALVLSHREASQSGIVVAALSAGRDVVATNVGGLAEQLAGVSRAILCAPSAPALAGAIAKLLKWPAPTAWRVLPEHDAFGAPAAKLVADLAAALL